MLVLIAGSSEAPAGTAGFNGTWTQLAATGPQPPPRRDVGAVYDSKRDRLVVLSGDGTTWALDLAEPTALWVQLPTLPFTSPSGYERAVYDAVGDRIVMVSANMQVFKLSLANPTAWIGFGISTLSPNPRTFFAVAHDTQRNRLILYGGGPYTGMFNDLWALDVESNLGWERIQPTGTPPPPTWGPLVVYDSGRDRLIIGTGALNTFAFPDVTGGLYSVDLTGSPAWTPLTATSGGRLLVGSIYDPAHQRMLLVGGFPGGWMAIRALSLEGPLVWEVLAPAGPMPPDRWSSNTFYRSAGPAMVVFGGHDGADFTDTWSLTTGLTSSPPRVLRVTPAGGFRGTAVSVGGYWLDTVNEVRFNGVTAPLISQDFEHVLTQVPAGATSGPITVTNPYGTDTSPESFVIPDPPVVSSADPESARVGDEIVVRGLRLTGATQVRFGPAGGVQPTVLSDTALTVVLDTLATSGPITVTTPAAFGASDFNFQVIPDDPRPRLLSVRDVSGDQGGRVMLRWRASDFDQLRYKRITGYRVWRRFPAIRGLLDARSLPQGWLATRAPGSAIDEPDVFWESLVELPAAFLKGYAYAAATLQDSTEDSNPYTAFFVQALTADPFVNHNSSPDSGYSVDNLAPPTPAPFTAHYGPAANTLHWRTHSLPDLREFHLHRGVSPTFVPEESSLLATTRDTTYVDLSGGYFYKLAAVDVHGNRSRFASLAPDQPVATLASFLRAERVDGRIRVIWFSGGNPGLPASVYRRTADADWQFQRLIVSNGSGYLNLDDPTVEDATRYSYRLGITEPDGEELSFGETWVDPLLTAFDWIGVPANPSVGGRVSLSLVLPSGSSADVRLFDIAGRELEAIELAAGSGTTRNAQFGATTRLRPGVYLVRATRGAEVLQRRVVVLN